MAQQPGSGKQSDGRSINLKMLSDEIIHQSVLGTNPANSIPLGTLLGGESGSPFSEIVNASPLDFLSQEPINLSIKDHTDINILAGCNTATASFTGEGSQRAPLLNYNNPPSPKVSQSKYRQLLPLPAETIKTKVLLDQLAPIQPKRYDVIIINNPNHHSPSPMSRQDSPSTSNTTSETASEPDGDGGEEEKDDELNPAAEAPRMKFNINWESANRASLCGTTGIKFVLRNGIFELTTPIPRMRKRGDDNEYLPPCQLCSAFAPSNEDFLKYRDIPPCSPECLVWSNPYIKEEERSKGTSRRERRERKRLKTEALASRPLPTGKPFTWMTYAAEMQCNLADVHAFSEAESHVAGQNHFEQGIWGEAIDPLHPHMFCLVEVVEIKGFRLRLHFTGYPDEYDFWVQRNSPFIFPPGWSTRNKKTLTPALTTDGILIDADAWKGVLSELNAEYLKYSGLFVNPDLIICDDGVASGFHGFGIGQKLEAVDKQHPFMICVATVRDILASRILIHFDGWPDKYDYWTEPYSSLIFEVGHCERNEISISVPNGYDPATFSWPKYLEETNSVPAPATAFIKRVVPRTTFNVNDRLEAVDPFCPRIIRIATILEVKDYQLKLQFDGWPEGQGEFFVDVDSCNIFPPGFCERSSHPILLPPGYSYGMDFLFAEPVRNTACPTKCCGGYGSLHSTMLYHNTLSTCPYTKPPLNDRLLDRLSRTFLPKGVPHPNLNGDERRAGCTTPGCDGMGHINPKFATHYSSAGCPIRQKNRLKRGRKASSDENAQSVSSRDVSLPADNGPQSDIGNENRLVHRNIRGRPRGSLGERNRQKRNMRSNQNYVPPEAYISNKLKKLQLQMANDEKDQPRNTPKLPMGWENSSPELRAQISSLAMEIRSTLCSRHLAVPSHDKSHGLEKPRFDTTAVPTVSDVVEAFGIDVTRIPFMDSAQVTEMVTRLFRSSDVAMKLEQKDITGESLVLLTLKDLIKLLELPIGWAVTLDGIIKLAREKCHLDVI